ncbi:unknown [Feldmannia species virus]|uniref:Uncharacterized protein n=1 Tax=Feldmannia species virus TaxID=39420 RepID=B5LWB5_9PHYC|nr:hypothetical protein FeldSpV_gp026 [Feldmannia species virus]ACH46778.1 unknown [Feldmannia species virus]
MNEKKNRKRVMTPAIEGMSVKMERSCLSEIRTLCPDITHEHVLANGWTAGKFALCYITGHHKKRKRQLHGADRRGSESPSVDAPPSNRETRCPESFPETTQQCT